MKRASCGQKVHSPVHSAWHFVGEATEDLTRADSRLWRTLLALLLETGFAVLMVVVTGSYSVLSQ